MIDVRDGEIENAKPISIWRTQKAFSENYPPPITKRVTKWGKPEMWVPHNDELGIWWLPYGVVSCGGGPSRALASDKEEEQLLLQSR
ncbi:hypothetical protein B296_00023031 [Ensete ventricosum]|uniref:Uncharacterized protein n=1 Tax=Ensete ventricosum TaxID=4639 RepID=A0A427A2R3_ENSVE|nr:hypothetical protein B296_00023031 [Ensete ventricosum]